VFWIQFSYSGTVNYSEMPIPTCHTHVHSTTMTVPLEQHSLLFFKGSGYRTTCGSVHLKPYSTTSCNVTVTHDENAIGLVET